MKEKFLRIRGCRTLNLTSVDLDLPLGKIILVTGPSGSGKTAMAVRTLFFESYLRYLESVSPMIRQKLAYLQKPDFDSIENLPPALLFKSIFPWGKEKEEIVAARAGLMPLLSICFTRLSELSCPSCGRRVRSYSVEEMIEEISTWNPEKVRLSFDYAGETGILRRRGLDTCLVGGRKETLPDKEKADSLRIWIDDLPGGFMDRSRLYEDIEIVRTLGGKCVIAGQGDCERFFPFRLFCPFCSLEFKPPGDDLFDFRTPVGACPSCRGSGVLPGVERQCREKEEARGERERCPDCGGGRYHPLVQAFRILDKTIPDVLALSVSEAVEFVDSWPAIRLHPGFALQDVIDDLKYRLNYLQEAGIGSIPLNRILAHISSGEYLRVALTSILCSGLNDSLIILDRPAEGLGSGDLRGIIACILRLKENGNTVLLVDGSAALADIADYFVEMGPGSGPEGGVICCSGNQFLWNGGQAEGFAGRSGLKGCEKRPVWPGEPAGEALETGIEGFTFSEGEMTVICGDSGSGKSRLLRDIDRSLKMEGRSPAPILVDVEQEPIDRRECIAGYLKIDSEIRESFAALKESRQLRMRSSHFSRLSPPGRCPECRGKGFFTVDMQFLPSLLEMCHHCRGSGFSGETLKISWKGKNIAQVYQSSLDLFFKEYPPADSGTEERLKMLISLNMGYLELGRRLEELSTGELRRLIMVRRMIPAPRGSLFLIDGPFLGLHQSEIGFIMKWFDTLLDEGAAVVIAENSPIDQHRGIRMFRLDQGST